jgi:hypothetical protein
MKTLLFLSLFFLNTMLHAMVSEELSLQDQWEQESLKALDYIPILQAKHVIFVPGLFHEMASGFNSYFMDNIEVAEKLGATTSYISLSSQNSIPYNAHILYRRIMHINKTNKKPIILVGHSKGGAEILYMLLIYPFLIIDDVVDSAILLQPAILGSPLTIYKENFFIDVIRNFLSPDLETLNPERSKLNFNEAYNGYEHFLNERAATTNKSIEELKQFFSTKINYVCSEMTAPEQLSTGIKIVLDTIGDTIKDDRHDGLLPISAQLFTPVGNVWGIIKCDHIGLVLKGPLSNVSSQERKAFMHLAFRKLFDATNFCVDEL